jgi:hypothetical protein
VQQRLVGCRHLASLLARTWGWVGAEDWSKAGQR